MDHSCQFAIVADLCLLTKIEYFAWTTLQHLKNQSTLPQDCVSYKNLNVLLNLITIIILIHTSSITTQQQGLNKLMLRSVFPYGVCRHADVVFFTFATESIHLTLAFVVCCKCEGR